MKSRRKNVDLYFFQRKKKKKKVGEPPVTQQGKRKAKVGCLEMRTQSSIAQ